MDALARFYAKVNRDGPLPEKHPEAGPCHLWTASTFASGYGQFTGTDETGNRRTYRAHRWLWKRLRGPLPDDVVLDHWACDRPACVNLDHMRPTTHRENVLRSETSWAAVNRSKTHCPADHPYEGENLRIRERDGARVCVTCTREKDAARHRARRARLRAARS